MAADSFRLGLIGTENSHADHYVQMANNGDDHLGVRVTCLAGDDSDRNRELAATGAVADRVATASELIGRVDAAIVCSRDGALHREQAEPLLRAGMPVLVDKPLACSVDDAQALIEAAEAGGVPLMSASALRYQPDVVDLADEVSRRRPQLVRVSGPADPDDQYGGIFFYGIHSVETAIALLGGAPMRAVSARRLDTIVVLTAMSGPTPVVVELVQPRDGHKVTWKAAVRVDDALLARQIDLGTHYLAPMMDVFVHMLRTGTAPLTAAELLEPVHVLETARAQIA